MFVSCCIASDWKLWLKRQCSRIQVGIGIHPWYVEKETLSIPKMRQYLLDNPKTFVGEIGLDRSKRYKATYAKQKEFFSMQLRLAKELQRPVCVHLVRSYADGYTLLKKYDIPSIYLHGFLGSIEEARRYPHAFFGFNPRNVSHPKGRRILNELHRTQILLESDGDSNREALQHTLQQIANVRGTNIYDMEQIINENARRWIEQS